MKKIFQYLLLPVMALALASCETDDESNPTLDVSGAANGFTLNMPALAQNNTYDLSAAEKLWLTCSQPNYGGVPYVTRYYVQVANEASFEAYKELATSFTTAKMGVDAYELNQAIVALFQEANPDTDYPNQPAPAYIRLRAIIDGYNFGESFSNIITLPSVLATYQAPKATLPTEVYVIGSSIGTAWSTWKPLAPVYDAEGQFYTMVYFPANGMFKWGLEQGDWRGGDRLRAINDNANAGVTVNEADNNNIQIANAGWYVLNYSAEIVGNSVQFELNIYPGKAYVIGNAYGDWTDSNDALAMTAPADASGEWVSPAATVKEELRAYIKVPGYEWWRTEFTLLNGGLYWRVVNILSNWAENVGAEYSVTMQPGQKLYVNFDTNTGEVR